MVDLAGGGSVALAVGVGDRGQVACDTCVSVLLSAHIERFSVLIDLNVMVRRSGGVFWYRCYYLHTLRDSVSPICRTFS